MLRRAVALSFVFVVALGGVAFAGLAQPLPIQILDAADLELAGTTSAQELIDATGDVYHPAGTPGDTHPSLDISRVEVSAWAIRLNIDVPEFENPFLAASFAMADILADGSDDDFQMSAPVVIANVRLSGDIRVGENVYCEYPLGWRDIRFTEFQGIDGDLFNGINAVTVARVGGAVAGEFEVASLAFVDGQWQSTDTIGWAAVYGDQVTFGIPAEAFGAAGDPLRSRALQFARGGGGTDAEPVDFNFGAFCSEGGLTFDPSLGGVDLLQTPIDVGGLPITVIGPRPAAQLTTTTAAPTTTVASTTATTTADESDDGGGGLNPALIALIVGGIGAAAWAAVRAAGNKAEDDDRPSGRSFRFSFDSGQSGSFSEVPGLSLESESIEYRHGSEPTHTRAMPGIAKHTNLTLKRATGDIAFWNWVLDSMNNEAPTGGGSISLLSESEPSMKWTFSDSWPSKVDGPGLKSTGAETGLESMQLTVENLRISGTP